MSALISNKNNRAWQVISSIGRETINVRIERHSWKCSSCKAEGETITSQTTDVSSFTEFVFRDHDLASPLCQCKTINVWPQGKRQNYWPIERLEINTN